MNAKQLEAFDIIRNGHSIFLGGGAGTGKSFLVSKIVRDTLERGKRVAVTCTTGIACDVYDSKVSCM